MLSVALESNGSPKKRTFSRGISEDESLRSIIKEVGAEIKPSFLTPPTTFYVTIENTETSNEYIKFQAHEQWIGVTP